MIRTRVPRPRTIRKKRSADQEITSGKAFYDDAFVAPEQLFLYDAIYRLVEGSGREHKSVGDVMVDQNDQPIRNLPLPSDPAAVRNYTETYSYDQIGNMLQMFHSAGVASWTRNYTYTAGTNRLASSSGGATYSYDLHGSMATMPHLPAITYSPFDQMKSALRLGGAGTVYFTYDAGGQRVRKVWEETAFIKHERIYLGSYEIFRKRVSGVVDLERQALHVNDGAQRIAMVETKTINAGVPVGTPVAMYRYQLGNHLGSAMLEVDETGLVISYEEMTPYGSSAYQAARSGVDVSARRYRYTGKERDEETGLYYNGARYLAAWLGRWTSADPIGMQAGVKVVTLTVTTNVDGADLSVDGAVVGKTPLTVPLYAEPGVHTIELKKIGFLSKSQRVDGKPGRDERVELLLEADVAVAGPGPDPKRGDGPDPKLVKDPKDPAKAPPPATTAAGKACRCW